MKLAGIALSLLGLTFLVFLGLQIYSFWLQKREISASLEELQRKTAAVHDENEQLRADMEYLLRPQNLKKELQKRFNYRYPGEQLMILVPASTSSPQP